MKTWLPHKMRLLRVRQGLTLVDAAKKTGVTRATLSTLERGHQQPIAPTLVKIAEGYGVPVEELLEEPSGPLVETPPSPDAIEADLSAGRALVALLHHDKDAAQWCISCLEDKEVAALTMAAFRLGDMARENLRIRKRYPKELIEALKKESDEASGFDGETVEGEKS